MTLYSKSLDRFMKSILPYFDLEEKDAYINAAMQAETIRRKIVCIDL